MARHAKALCTCCLSRAGYLFCLFSALIPSPGLDACGRTAHSRQLLRTATTNMRHTNPQIMASCRACAKPSQTGAKMLRDFIVNSPTTTAHGHCALPQERAQRNVRAHCALPLLRKTRWEAGEANDGEVYRCASTPEVCSCVLARKVRSQPAGPVVAYNCLGSASPGAEPERSCALLYAHFGPFCEAQLCRIQ